MTMITVTSVSVKAYSWLFQNIQPPESCWVRLETKYFDPVPSLIWIKHLCGLLGYLQRAYET